MKSVVTSLIVFAVFCNTTVLCWARPESDDDTSTVFGHNVWEPDMVRVRVNVNKLIQLMSTKESNENILLSFLKDFLQDRFVHLGLDWWAATVMDATEEIDVAEAITGGDNVAETSYLVHMLDNATNSRYMVDFRVQLREVGLQLRRLQLFASETLCTVSKERRRRARPNVQPNTIITVAINTETLFRDRPDEFVSYFSEPRYGKECLFSYVFVELDKYEADLTSPTFHNNVEKWLHFMKYSHLLSKDEILRIYDSHESIIQLYHDFFEELCEVIGDLDVQQMKIESDERRRTSATTRV